MADFLNDLFCALSVWTKRARHDIRVWMRRFLRTCYRLGWKMCAFIAGVAVFVIVGVILAIAIPQKRRAEAEALALQIAAMATPTPSAAPSATPAPTETPVPEELTWVTKGAEGDDVLALQTRLMELGYLEIDEPTSYFGNVTQYAVKLFQRQHELQMDGIVGAQTFARNA